MGYASAKIDKMNLELMKSGSLPGARQAGSETDKRNRTIPKRAVAGILFTPFR
jgi:hypothetical protein